MLKLVKVQIITVVSLFSRFLMLLAPWRLLWWLIKTHSNKACSPRVIATSWTMEQIRRYLSGKVVELVTCILWTHSIKSYEFVQIMKSSALCVSPSVEKIWLIHGCTTPSYRRANCKCTRAQSSLVCCKQIHWRQEIPQKYSGNVVVLLVYYQNITFTSLSFYFYVYMLSFFGFFSDMHRSKWYQQGLRPPCSSSSFSTGWTRMRPQDQVSPTPLITSPRWSRFHSTPLPSTATLSWLPSMEWWMMALGKSRYVC